MAGQWPQRCLGTDPALWLKQSREEGLDLQPSCPWAKPNPCLSLPLCHFSWAGVYTSWAFVPVGCLQQELHPPWRSCPITPGLLSLRDFGLRLLILFCFFFFLFVDVQI